MAQAVTDVMTDREVGLFMLGAIEAASLGVGDHLMNQRAAWERIALIARLTLFPKDAAWEPPSEESVETEAKAGAP